MHELVKFADDLTLEVPGFDYGDTSMIEIKNIEIWSKRNRMDLNMKKHTKWSFIKNILTPLPAIIINYWTRSSKISRFVGGEQINYLPMPKAEANN